MTAAEKAAEAYARATQSPSLANYPAIFQGFMDRGIPEEAIRPRENVFTFHAWRAKGRTVRKGEHGVKVITWKPITRTDPKTGKETTLRIMGSATVFHVSQTEPLQDARL